MSKLAWPCKLEADGLHPCCALDDVLEPPYGAGTKYQGIKLNTMISLGDLKFSRHLVVAKSGKHSKKGVVFNFCPFCGESVLHDELQPGESK
jgi:hypothetical protein